jgi:hypothetical protein
VTGDSALTGMVTVAGASRLSPRVAPCAASGEARDHGAELGETAPQGATVAPIARVRDRGGDEDGNDRDER